MSWRMVAAGLLLCCGASACAEPPSRLDERGARKSEKTRMSEPLTGSPAEIYPTLDAYLAFLAKGAAIDKPWYRQIRPGVYQLETGNYRPLGEEEQQRIFTREELERQFGFRRD